MWGSLKVRVLARSIGDDLANKSWNHLNKNADLQKTGMCKGRFARTTNETMSPMKKSRESILGLCYDKLVMQLVILIHFDFVCQIWIRH